MKIIDPSVTYVPNTVPYKKMEYAGRLCYRSENNIKEDSYIPFIKKIIEKGHLSILEHESISMLVYDNAEDITRKLFNIIPDSNFYAGFFNISSILKDGYCYSIISANVRAWYELLNYIFKNSYYSLLKCGEQNIYIQFYKTCTILYPIIFSEHIDDYVDYLFPILTISEIKDLLKFIPNENSRNYEINKHCYESFVFTTSRSVSHQLVRHRKNSVSQSSQRYCNYSSNKFNHSIDFILPYSIRQSMINADILTSTTLIAPYLTAYSQAEQAYFDLIDIGTLPETAREVLPNGTSTTIMSTANIEQWKKVIDLRCDSHAQGDIRELITIVKENLEKEYNLNL